MATVTVDSGVASRPSRSETREQMARLIAFVFALDFALLLVTVPTALLAKFGTLNPEGLQWLTGNPIIDFGWIVPLWLGTLAVQDAYSHRTFTRGSDEFRAVLRASITAALVGALLCYFINYDLSRGFY